MIRRRLRAGTLRAGRAGLLALALVVAAPHGADAEKPAGRVVMVAAPPGLESAVEAALAGWPIQVTSATGEPGATMPEAGEKARAIGQAQGAGAVVWIASDGSGHALWVLDVESGRVTARQLPVPPPWDDVTAAAVALSVKTLLRHSQVAPVLERYGVEEAREVLRAELERARPVAPPEVRESPLRLETLAGARIRPTEADDVELRLGAGLRWVPPWFGGRASAAARIRSGTGTGLNEESFVGRYTDVQTGLSAAARILTWGRIALVPAAGASLHFTSIDGSIRSQGTRGRAARVNPSLDTALAIEIQVGQLVRVSVGAELSYALRRQAYLVGGDPVLTLPTFESEFAAQLSVPVY
jgi:hypothetical protein